MKIQFDSSLSFQQDAIDSIVDIFKGQEICESNFTVYTPEVIAKKKNIGLNEIGYGNRLIFNEDKIFENVQNIQLSNGLKLSTRNEEDKIELDFTVEMETGTGKTYVYLRTILDLYVKYGFSKHIIIVPSISIKEGVYKSLQITRDHLRELYNNINYYFFIYDSSKLNEVRDFATNDRLEIMIINIDAFSKSFENLLDEKKTANIIHRYNDSLGYKPLDLIKNTNPFIIIDEPQTTMSTPLRKKAVQSLTPLAIVRYSATHKEKINLMYKLDAVDAYEKKLVKQIEVGSIQTQGSNNQVYIRFIEIKVSKGFPVAKIELDIFKGGSISRKTITVKKNDDLEQLTNRTEYEGYIIKDIYASTGNEYIDFTSKEDVIKLGESIGNVDDKQIKTALIAKTIEEHLNKELILNKQGIKVLSLFFIDTVSKYRIYDEDGKQANGEYADIFEKEYDRLKRKPKYAEIKDIQVNKSEVHNGYFSIDKKSKRSNSKDKFEYFKDTTGSSSADEDTYNLIMRDKEMLLSFDSKLRFIFSHSALKEGWDNPNVFQICTLKEAGGSETRRRQEIGRGLRLCVNQNGERVYGHEVNTLTVMATESYVDFVDNFQKEIESETGIKFGMITQYSFSNVVVEIIEKEITYLGQEMSGELFTHLINKEYIDVRGKVQDTLRIALKEGKVEIPDEFTENPTVLNQILKILKETSGKLEIKNNSQKVSVSVNKQILDSPEFKELWERVKYKTTFSVHFDSDKLINDCITELNERLTVNRGKLTYTKGTLTMNTSGVKVGNVVNEIENLYSHEGRLPDILSYLQNETHLTRKSIVNILTSIDNLHFFKENPQKFIEDCIEIINDQMRLNIVDGIQYKKIGDAEYYSQELFENEELFGYLKDNLKESKKSPYEYVVYDSNIESTFVTEFEKSSNIEVYAKLPDWFKIETPLGTYNPDWAVLWKGKYEEKLYFVVESKGSNGESDLRSNEKSKIKCGKKHFKAIGSEMIVASGMDDVKNYALNKLLKKINN